MLRLNPTLNNARAYSSLVSRENNDAYVALIDACQALYAQDAKRNRPSFGVEMSVVEVKKIFGEQSILLLLVLNYNQLNCGILACGAIDPSTYYINTG